MTEKKPRLPERTDIGEGSNYRPEQSEAILTAMSKLGRAVTLNEIMNEIGDKYKKGSTRFRLYLLKIEGMVIRHPKKQGQDAFWSLRGGSKNE